MFFYLRCLHDVLEDRDVTEEEMEELLLGILNLRQRTILLFNEGVAESRIGDECRIGERF